VGELDHIICDVALGHVHVQNSPITGCLTFWSPVFQPSTQVTDDVSLSVRTLLGVLERHVALGRWYETSDSLVGFVPAKQLDLHTKRASLVRHVLGVTPVTETIMRSHHTLNKKQPMHAMTGDWAVSKVDAGKPWGRYGPARAKAQT
jgi:hypothetical protein